MSPGWPGNASVSPRKSWRKCLGRGKSGHLCLDSCPRDPVPYKRKKMHGWMDNVFLAIATNIPQQLKSGFVLQGHINVKAISPIAECQQPP